MSGTGIVSIENGTSFFTQGLGQGASFDTLSAITVVNLMYRGSDFRPYRTLSVAITLISGYLQQNTYYVLMLQGSTLTIRSAKVTNTVNLPALNPNQDTHTFVGAFAYSTSITSVLLYPILQISVPAPPVGSNDILQGESYSVRLTIGAENTSTIDIIASDQTIAASNVSVQPAAPTDGSNPRPGEMYFGSFLGGAQALTLWNVPVFLQVVPSQLPSTTSFIGSMTMGAIASGKTSYNLPITDASLFVYTNINIDTGAIGSVSFKSIFLAQAALNSTPDNTTSAAFAPVDCSLEWCSRSKKDQELLMCLSQKMIVLLLAVLATWSAS